MLNKVMWAMTRPKGPFFRRVAAAAERYALFYRDFSYDFDRNGERRVIEAMAAHDPRVVFDVGANVGDWSRMAARAFPNATIHAFELSPATFERFAASTRDPRIVANNLGLGAREEVIEFKDYGPANSTRNTLTASTQHDVPGHYTMRTARIATGDGYLAARSISRIDFLKIDVEGAEHMVLEGLQGALADHRIRAIQFEYGYANGDAKFLMKDFYRLLEGFGYVIGKVGARGVAFGPFEYAMNNFLSGPNYFALLADEVDLRASLSDRP